MAMFFPPKRKLEESMSVKPPSQPIKLDDSDCDTPSPPRKKSKTADAYSGSAGGAMEADMKAEIAGIQLTFEHMNTTWHACVNERATIQAEYRTKLDGIRSAMSCKKSGKSGKMPMELLLETTAEEDRALQEQDTKLRGLGKTTGMLCTRMHTQIMYMRGAIRPRRWPELEKAKQNLECLREAARGIVGGAIKDE